MRLSSPPPGVSAPSQIAVALGVVGVVFALLGWLLLRERTGRRTLLGAVADRLAALDGAPRWAAVTPFLQTASVLLAGFGVWWDISFHLDFGRDEGPFGTPAHYPIFFGLLGILASGIASAALAREPLAAGALPVRRGWRLPLSAAFVVVCGAFSLTGFPLDDAWHRIFGEDVTLWGPTHILMIGGAVLALFALLLVRAEATQVSGPRRRYVLLDTVTAGALLVGLELFATEYDFGVPQFPLLTQPLLLVLATVLPLVLIRIRRGRGTALGALVVYLVVRGGITLLVGGPLGRVMPHFPPFVVEAVLVEAVALLVGTGRRVRFGVLTGVVVGVGGVLAEDLWSHVWMPIAWPAALLPAAMGLGVVVGVGAGLVGAWMAARLAEVDGRPGADDPDDDPGDRGDVAPPPAGRREHVVALAGLVAVVAAFAVAVPRTAHTDVSARVSLTQVSRSPRTAVVTVQLLPADAADHARWFLATSWQGGGTSVGPMTRLADGRWRTPTAMPLDGRWKSTIRLHRGRGDLLSLPIRMPADPEIGKPEVLVTDGATARFLDEEQVLRREERSGLPGWYWTVGYAALGLVSLAELAVLAWLLARAGSAATRRGVTHGIPSGRVPSLSR